MHQFVEAGIALYNPDELARPVNSPKAVYQIESQLLEVLKKFGTAAYSKQLKAYLSTRGTLTKRYAKERAMKLVPLKLKNGKEIHLSAGKHSELIKAIWETEVWIADAPSHLIHFNGNRFLGPY